MAAAPLMSRPRPWIAQIRCIPQTILDTKTFLQKIFLLERVLKTAVTASCPIFTNAFFRPFKKGSPFGRGSRQQFAFHRHDA